MDCACELRSLCVCSGVRAHVNCECVFVGSMNVHLRVFVCLSVLARGYFRVAFSTGKKLYVCLQVRISVRKNNVI